MPPITNTEYIKMPTPASPETGSNKAENKTYVYDGAGEARNKILHAPEWIQGEVILPKDAVTVNVNADNVHEDSALDMSRNVSKLLDKGAFSGIGLTDGYRRAGAFTTLSSLDTNLYTPFNRHRKLGEPDRSVTFIYDASLAPTEEAVILPSALMVRGELTPDQFKKLREQFPSVPFVNSKNELLDDVGRAERREAREKYEQDMRLGRPAVKKNVRLDLSKITPEFMAEKRAAFHRAAGDMQRAQQIFEGYDFSDFTGSSYRKGEQYQSSVPREEGIKIDKTHIPSAEPEKPVKKEWNITPEASADDIAKQAIDNIIPRGVAMTPEKLNEFSNKVKRELSKKRIHPDVDERAKEVYSKIDDELMKRRDESRTTV